MTAIQSANDSESDVVIAEYQAGLELSRHWSMMRRQDMVFVTTFQGAVLTIIRNDLMKLDAAAVALSLMAFLVVILGLNSERRVFAYMRANVERLIELENSYGMRLLHAAEAAMSKLRGSVSNGRVFFLYYVALGLTWLVIWTINIAT